MANCPSCGGFLKFDIEEQKLRCSFCDSLYDPYKIDQVNNVQDHEDGFGVTVFSCPRCGGELMSTGHDLSGNCSFCGSPVVFDVHMRKEKLPKKIIPFKITKEDCKEKYMKAIQACRFAPKALKDPNYIEGFRGIYVPYWLYTVEMDGEPFDVKGTYKYTQGDTEYVETYRLEGKNEAIYTEISHDASSILQDDIGEQLEPFEFEKGRAGLRPFTPSFFSGFYAEPADVESEVYHTYAKDIAVQKAKDYLDHKSSYAAYGIANTLPSSHYACEVTDAELALLPVWFLSYRKKNRVAYAAINGQTGQMTADVPIDLLTFFKYLILAFLGCFAFMSILTILPKTVTMLSVIVSYAVSRFCIEDIKIATHRGLDQSTKSKRAQFIDSYNTLLILGVILGVALFVKIMMYFDSDISWAASNFIYVCICLVFCVIQVFHSLRSVRSMKQLIKAKYWGGIYPILCMAASFYGTYILHLRPVRDEVYYSAALVVIGVALVSFLGIIRNYNRIATRPLPQFTLHKGGDDNA